MNPASKPNKTYVKIGSDIKYISAYTKNIKLTIKEFIAEFTNQSSATLFAISYLDNKLDIVKNPFDYNADKTITFSLAYSEGKTVDEFLLKSCSRCTPESFKKIKFYNQKIGNTIFDGYITGVTNIQGNSLGHFFGIKKTGCMYVILEFNFPNMDSFESYKSYLKGLSIN